MRYKGIFGALIVVGILMFTLIPTNFVHADISGGHNVANYIVVYQDNGLYYKKIIGNSIGEADGYVFTGTNGNIGYRVVFVELVRHNSDWRIDSNGYTQYIMASHGETVVYYNGIYGVCSPYPRNGGKGYNAVDSAPHNAIGNAMGGFVDVSTNMKFDNWYMYQGNDSNLHWIYHEYKGGEESYWNHAAIGGAFYFGNSQNNIRVTLVKWKVVSGWWIFESHKDMLNGNVVTVYLKTS